MSAARTAGQRVRNQHRARPPVSDETHIGGKIRNKHRQCQTPGRVGGKGRAGGRNRNSNETVVLSLVDKDSGEVRSRIIPDVTGATLRKVIAEQVDMGSSVLHTDGLKEYRQSAASSRPMSSWITRPTSTSAATCPPISARST